MRRVILLLALLMVCAVDAHGQGGAYTGTAFGPNIPVKPGASVTVCTLGSTVANCGANRVMLYTDVTLTTPAQNPATTDGAGNFTVYAGPGTYNYIITGAGITPPTVPFVFTIGCSPGSVISTCAGSNPSLTATQVGFGSGSNLLSGQGMFRFTTPSGNLGVPAINNMFFVDGIKYTTPQACINAITNPGICLIPSNVATGTWTTPANYVGIQDTRFQNDGGLLEGLLPNLHTHSSMTAHAGANSSWETLTGSGQVIFAANAIADGGGTSGLNDQANLVGLFAGANRSALSNRPIWAANFLCNDNNTASASTCRALELDVNSSSNDAGATDVGLQVISGGSFHPGFGIFVNSSVAQGYWNEGVSINNFQGIGLHVANGASGSFAGYFVPPDNTSAPELLGRDNANLNTTWQIDNNGKFGVFGGVPALNESMKVVTANGTGVTLGNAAAINDGTVNFFSWAPAATMTPGVFRGASAQTNPLLTLENNAGSVLSQFLADGNLQLPITGLTQCLQADSTGHVAGTGVACGTGSGGSNITVNGSAALPSPVNFQNGPAAIGLTINALNPSGSNVDFQVAGTVSDGGLANPYSGVGACGSHLFASTLVRNTAPTCTQPTLADIAAGIAPSGTFNFSNVTLFQVRSSAGLTTSVAGDIGYDTTNHNYHGFNNATDLIFPMVPSGTPVNGNCVNWVVTSSNIRFGDAGGACGTGAGSVTTFSGDGALLNNSGSTGAVTATLATVAANKVWGNNTGSTAAPNYVSIVNAMLPGAGVTTVNGQSCALNGTCTIPFQTNSVNNTSQAGVNLSTSTTNAVGLTVTPVNSATNVEKFEVTGSVYSGSAATLAATSTCSTGQKASGINISGTAQDCTAKVGTAYGGTNADSSASTGVPLVVGGVWTFPATVGATYGGLGLNTSAATGLPYDTAGTWAVSNTIPAAAIWNGTVIAATYGGTGQNTSASTGLPYVTAGAWAFSNTIPAAAILGNGVTATTQTTGDNTTKVATDAFVNASITALGAYVLVGNCSSSASPAVCSTANAGSVVVAAGATTVVVNTSAVTANSQILLTFDASLGTKLSVTCNTTNPLPYVTARAAGTSFTITSSSPVTNPACISYMVIN